MVKVCEFCRAIEGHTNDCFKVGADQIAALMERGA